MKRYAWLVIGAATVVTATGCQDRKQLTTALAEAKAAEAEKDSLLTEVLETTQFVTDMNSELAKVKGVAVNVKAGDPGVPGATADREARGAALDRIKQVITRLNESETKLAETEKRAKQSRQRNARLLAQIETFKKTIDDLRTSAEQQKTQYESIITDQQHKIGDQQGQIATLNSKVDTLAATKAALTDTVSNLTSYKNTVYYAVGTKDELLKKGVIVKEGSKFLFFGGSRYEPARTVVPEAYTAVDKTQATSIPLPHPDKKYKIVSRQNPSYLASTVSRDGKVSGESVQIAHPEEFWSASKYLVLVQD